MVITTQLALVFYHRLDYTVKFTLACMLICINVYSCFDTRAINETHELSISVFYSQTKRQINNAQTHILSFQRILYSIFGSHTLLHVHNICAFSAHMRFINCRICLLSTQQYYHLVPIITHL